jgi:hypothetical protein
MPDDMPISCGDFACSYHATLCNILVEKRLHVRIHVYKGKSQHILAYFLEPASDFQTHFMIHIFLD